MKRTRFPNKVPASVSMPPDLQEQLKYRASEIGISTSRYICIVLEIAAGVTANKTNFQSKVTAALNRSLNKKVSRFRRNVEYIPDAKYIAEVLTKLRQRKIADIDQGSYHLGKLAKSFPDERKAHDRIMDAIDWYANNYERDEYLPDCTSVVLFATKFDSIESNMQRANRGHKVQPGNGASRTNGHNKHSTWKQDAHDFFGKRTAARDRYLELVPKAIKIFTHDDQDQVAEALLGLFIHFREDEIRNPSSKIEDFLEWIEEQHWIDYKTISILDPGSKLFERFKSWFAKVRGRDLLTDEYHVH